MKLKTIEVDRDELKAIVKQTQRIAPWKRTTEDKRAIVVSKALDRGLRVINLQDVIRAGGVAKGTTGIPALAAARADHETVLSGAYATPNGSRVGLLSYHGKDRPLIGKCWAIEHSAAWNRGTATVPPVPVRLRPKDSLSNYVTLFEAEWKPQVMPKDPALLRQLFGSLYSIIAEWDLTDLERAILGEFAQRVEPGLAETQRRPDQGLYFHSGGMFETVRVLRDGTSFHVQNAGGSGLTLGGSPPLTR